jgi:hypothetical protein
MAAMSSIPASEPGLSLEKAVLIGIKHLASLQCDLDDPKLMMLINPGCSSDGDATTPTLNNTLIHECIKRGWPSCVDALLTGGSFAASDLEALEEIAQGNGDSYILDVLTHHKTRRSRTNHRSMTAKGSSNLRGNSVTTKPHSLSQPASRNASRSLSSHSSSSSAAASLFNSNTSPFTAGGVAARAAALSIEDDGDEFFSHSTLDLTSTQSIIHEDYTQWSSSTRIENLIYLLDSLKKKEHGIQNDLLDVTDARKDAKGLLSEAKGVLAEEEIKISDRVRLIKVLEHEVRGVIENLTDKIQALKREEKMGGASDGASTSDRGGGERDNSSSAGGSTSLWDSGRSIDGEKRSVARASSVKTEVPSSVELTQSPSFGNQGPISPSFVTSVADLSRDSEVRLNKLLTPRSSTVAATTAIDAANRTATPAGGNKTLADVRNERAVIEKELLNIISEREALLQKLHRVQTLKHAAATPPHRPVDKIKMLRAPMLTPPTSAVYKKLTEMDKDKFSLEEPQAGIHVGGGGRKESCSSENESYMSLQLSLGECEQEMMGGGSSAGVLSSTSSHAISSAQSQIAAGLEKLWSSDRAAAESLELLEKTVELREHTMERLKIDNESETDSVSFSAALVNVQKTQKLEKVSMESILGGGIKTPDVDVFEKSRRNSVLTMSGKKVAIEKEGLIAEEDGCDASGGGGGGGGANGLIGVGGERVVSNLFKTDSTDQLYDVGL